MKLRTLSPLLLVVLFTALFGACVLRLEGLGLRLPSWDPATHGMESIQLVDALQKGNIGLFLHRFFELTYWPPVYALFQVPFYALFGFQYLTAHGLILFSTFAAVALLAWTAYEINPRDGFSVALIAATFFLLSPETGEAATTIMLEIPGIAVTFAACAAYLRYLRTSEVKWWRRACLLSTIVFFTKYNYGILWLAPLVGFEAWCNRQALWTFLSSHVTTLPRPSWRRPFPWLVAGYIGFLAYVHLTGGGAYVVFGQKVLITTIWGNPLYALVLLILLRYALFQRAALRTSWRWLKSLPEPAHALVFWSLLPIACWFAIPKSFHGFFNSMINQSKRDSFFSLKTLTFYPEAFVDAFHPSPVLGVLAGLLVLATIPLWRRSIPAVRFIAIVAAVGFLACVAHPNYIARYLMTVAPFLWLLAACHLHTLLSLITPRLAMPAMVLAALAMAATWFSPATLQGRFEASTLPPDFAELPAMLCDAAKDVRVTATIGFSPSLSPSLVGWECLRRHPEMTQAQLPLRPLRLGFRSDFESAEEWFAKGTVDQIIVISSLTGEHARWKDADVREALYPTLAASPALQRHARDFPGEGYRIEIFRR